MMTDNTLSYLIPALRSGQLALQDYLAELEARFESVEPRLHAFVPETGRFERLRREASELARRYPVPDSRPALYGMAVGVKDIFHVAGLTTRAGTALPSHLFQGEESAAVSALRRTGALVLGKTVTTEFAYFAPGPTRHPLSNALGADYTPGGSSSGSAAAVAAGLSPLALGTQTIGSITRPAAFCGVTGFKPSFGRISTDGVLPLSPSADTIGFFVATAADIAPAAAVLVSGWQSRPEYITAPVLAVPVGSYLDRAPRETRAHLAATCDRLAAAGAVIREIATMPDFDVIYTRHNQLVAAEAAAVHADWYAAYGSLYHPKTAELILHGRAVTPAELAAARESRAVVRAGLQRQMDEYGIDAWLAPAALGSAPRGLGSTGDPVMNLPWTHAGLPTVALPAGHDQLGLPLGIQLAGRFGGDERLVWVAAAVEAMLA